MDTVLRRERMLQHLFFTIDLQPRTLLRCFVKLFVRFPHGGLPLWKTAEKECLFRALSESYNPPSIPPILPFLWTPKNIFHVLSASLLPQRDLIIDLFLSHLSIFLANLSKSYICYILASFSIFGVDFIDNIHTKSVLSCNTIFGENFLKVTGLSRY